MRTAPVPPPINTDLTRSVSLGCPTESDVGPAWLQSQNAPFIRPQTAPEISSFPSFNRPHNIYPTDNSIQKVPTGSFIAFQFDKDYAKDKKMLLPLGRYIGVVVASNIYKSGDDGRWNEELTVKFVARGPPEIEGREKHYMPIASSSSDVGKMSLKTNDLFLRPNIVQWTTFDARLHIRTLDDDRNSLKFALQDDEIERLEVRVREDTETVDGFPLAAERLPISGHNVYPCEVWTNIRETRWNDPNELLKMHF